MERCSAVAATAATAARAVERARLFHEETKNHPSEVGDGGSASGGAPPVVVPRRAVTDAGPPGRTVAWLSGPGDSAPPWLGAAQLARVLALGAGIVRLAGVGGRVLPIRAFPSAGSLYPVELYAACGELDRLAAGVYRFDVETNRVRPVLPGDARAALARASSRARLGGAGAILIATIRPAAAVARYGLRGHRQAYWDAGAMIGTLLAAAGDGRLDHEVVTGFVDADVDRLLGVDAVTERAVALVALGAAPAAAASAEVQASDALAPVEEWDDVARAVCLERPDDVERWRARSSPRAGDAKRAVPEGRALADAIRTRGSTRRFARAPIRRVQFDAVLAAGAAAYPADVAIDSHIRGFVHAVAGLESGVFARDPADDLRMLRTGDVRAEAAHACLDQPQGGTAAATAFVMADLDRLLAALGMRGYALAHLDAGIRAGRMYLASYACGLGATALTFYDDVAREKLGGGAGPEPLLAVAFGIDAGRRALRSPAPARRRRQRAAPWPAATGTAGGDSASAPGNAWRPLLAGPDAAEARAAIDAIADAVCRRPDPDADPSLATGRAGIALFLCYLARLRPGAGFAEAAASELRQAVRAVAATPMRPSLFSGFAGVGFACAHAAPFLGETIGERLTEGIDSALVRLGSRSPWRRPFDLAEGLVGLGVYALERLPAPSARVLLERVVDRLEELAQLDPDGLTWPTPPHLVPGDALADFPSGRHDLGMAHGVPGIMALLAAAARAGVGRDRAPALLPSASAWLLAQELPSDGPASRFPSWLAPDGPTDRSPTAWCYGEPGIASALLLVSQATGNPLPARHALRIARRMARRPSGAAGVADHGLCHGTAGVAHICNRLWQQTSEPLLRQAAQRWFRRTLHARDPRGGGSGYRALRRTRDGELFAADEPGVLVGAAGIGLALIAATTELAPDWDRMLLLSSRAGRSAG